MVEAKWRWDRSLGEGHRVDQAPMFFSAYELKDYPGKVLEYIKNGHDGRTNEELFRFGYENGFLPSHTKKVLDENSAKIDVKSLDGFEVRGRYIGDKNRKIRFRYIEEQ
jgi:hypothetical protein